MVLNYKTAGMTLKAAEAALAAMEGLPGGLTIVDNDSQDGSYQTLSATVRARGWDADGQVMVVQSGRNGGYGAGNNFGMTAAGERADYIYVLNPDAFPGPGAIRALLDHMEANPRTGFAGSYVHGPEVDGVAEPHSTAFRFPGILSEFEGAIRTGPFTRLLSRHVVAMGSLQETQPADWVTGASLMMRREALEETGLFDENFFLYFEETDLCRRVRQAGWDVTFVRESEVLHIGSVSTGMKERRRMPDYWFDSRHYYFARNHGRLYAAAATAAHVLGALGWRARCLLTGRSFDCPPRFLRDLIAHFLRKGLRPVPARRCPQLPPQQRACAPDIPRTGTTS